MRTLMIYFMGVQYLGLNSLFTSILQVLNLAELGVGSAMVFSMYKPIAEDDSVTICALMKMYKTYYRVIGLVIAVVGAVCTPFVPKLIKSDLPPDLNVYVLYLLNLAVTVLSYWLFAYKNSLLQAHQRNDVSSKVSLITNTVQYALQILVLVTIKDYYVYTIVALLTQAITNIATAMVANKMYSNYKPKGKLPKEMVNQINQRIKDLFTSKIGAIVVNSADTIVISAFLGLNMLAIYQNYFYILSSIIGFVAILFGACTAGIGNSIIVETPEKNFKDLKKFTFIIAWIGGFCAASLLCLYQPFMDIWVGKDLELNFSAVICFCIYYFVYEINQLLNTYKDASGMWHEDKWRPLVTAMANLLMNLIMVQFWGIYGIILSTVLSMLFVGMPWLLHNLFTVLFSKKHLMPYLKQLLFYVAIVFVGCVLTYLACSPVEFNNININFGEKVINIGKWLTLIVRGIICCIIPNVVFLIAYHKLPEFKDSLSIANRMTKGKISFIRKMVDKNA